MMKIQRSWAAIAAVLLFSGLSAPADAQVVCQKTAKSGKLTFKLREICKANEIEAQNLSTQPSGLLHQRSGPICLSNAGGTPVAVIPEFELPDAGEWLISAKADAVNLLGAQSDYFRCTLTVDGQVADASTAHLSNVQVGDLKLLAYAPGGSLVGLSCQHDNPIANDDCPALGGAYVESAKLSAVYLKTFSHVVVP